MPAKDDRMRRYVGVRPPPQVKRDRAEMPKREGYEPAESDPGFGWLRSRARGYPWPREGHMAACGRDHCLMCGAA